MVNFYISFDFVHKFRSLQLCLRRKCQRVPIESSEHCGQHSAGDFW